jgi:hypothetical protein
MDEDNCIVYFWSTVVLVIIGMYFAIPSIPTIVALMLMWIIAVMTIFKER